MSPFRARSLACILLITVTLFGQNPKSGDKKKPNNAGGGEKSAPRKSDPDPKTRLQGGLTTALSHSETLGDYIKCEFTREELLNLRPEPELYRLTAADEEQIRKTVIEEVFDPSNVSAFPGGNASAFAREISETSLTGKTRAQAVATVLSIMEKYSAATAESSELLAKASSSDPDPLVTLLTSKGIAKEKAKTVTGLSLAARINKVAELADSAEGDDNKKTLTKAAKDATASLAETAAKNTIADAARNATTAMGPPLDVGCSMSILSYRTNKYAFGEKLAREYIPVQIVVRNLNPDKEFLVQDAEFAVETDINGRHGRYAAGVDKLTVRTFMLAAHDYAPIPFIVHAAEGAGTVLSSASLVYGSAVKDAANVYNSGFIKALNHVLTDHATEQLNLLNDEGFSSYRTERTVVPKSGTAEFVVFVEAKQFAEGWWTQDCAKNTIMKLEHKKTDFKQTAACIGAMNKDNPSPKCFDNVAFSDDRGIGVDLDAVRHVCLDETVKSEKHMWHAVQTGDENAIAYSAPKRVDYKHWSPTALQLFRELSYSVVAGTHIVEESDTKPTLSKISCPTTEEGNVEVSKASNNTLSCPLTGTNLDKVANLKLRNVANQTDKSATATVSTSGDSKSATAAFPLDQLCALNAQAYKAYTITKDGAEDDSSLPQLNFSLSPSVPGSPSPAQVDLSKLPQTLAFSGCHLDKLKTLKLSGGGKNASIPADSDATATGAKFTLTKDNMKDFAGLDAAKDNQVTMILTDSDDKDAALARNKLGVTGSLPASAKPTEPKKPPAKKTPPTTPKKDRGAAYGPR